jgi:hypothetical protein
MKFIIELEIGLFFPLKSALSKLKTDRNTKTHRRGRSKQQYGLADAPQQRRANLALALAIFWVATSLVAAGVFLASQT